MGYNFSYPTCIDNGCVLEYNHCIRTTHAEIAALNKLDDTEDISGCTIYVVKYNNTSTGQGLCYSCKLECIRRGLIIENDTSYFNYDLFSYSAQN